MTSGPTKTRGTSQSGMRAFTGFAALLTTLLLSAGLITAIAGPAASADDGFARSPGVRSGNYWNPDGVLYGYYPSWAGGPSGSFAQISYHDAQVDPAVSIGHLFSGGYPKNFNQAKWDSHLTSLATHRANGIIPMYSTGVPKNADGMNALDHMRALAAGDPEAVQQVQQWAFQLQEADLGPVIIRLGHEGDRTDRPWIANGEPELYVGWFQAFHDIVETPAPAFDGVNDLAGLDNIIWAWTPAGYGFKRGFENNTTVPPLAETRATAIFPGVDYVDWIGSSGYDQCLREGANLNKGHLKTHEEILEQAGQWAATYAPELPFMLAEWGSIETAPNPDTGQTRASFFDTTRELLRSDLPGLDQIGAVVYFDRAHDSGDGICDWRLQGTDDSYPEPNEAFNSPANLAGNVQVNVNSDFGAYQDLANTPGLFVAPGPFEAVVPTPACAVLGTTSGVEVTWSDFPAGKMLHLRSGSPMRWRQSFREQSAQPTLHVPDHFDTLDYVLRYRVNGTVFDVPCGAAAAISSEPERTATFVVGSTNLSADDAAVRDLLADSFDAVDIVDDGATADINDGSTDVIVFSATSSSSTARALRGYSTSVVILKPWAGSSTRLGVFDDGMSIMGSASIFVTESSHPLVAGLNPGRVVFTSDPTPSQSRGDATAEATVIATAGSRAGGKAAVALLPAGSLTSAGTLTPGCRISLPMFKGGTAAALTPAGSTLFSNAVVHAADGCPGDVPAPEPEPIVAAAVVVGDPAFVTADDQRLLQMVQQNFGEANVALMDDNSISAGQDIYVVAPSVSSGVAGENAILQTTDAAVVTLKPWVGNNGRLGMFRASGIRTTSTITNLVAGHDVTEGFTDAVVLTDGPSLSFGRPNTGGDVLATLPTGDASLIVFEPGALQVNGQAVGCRALFPTFKKNGIALITNDGETLFGQLLDFASGDCISN